ncbi:hypothetical protein ACE7GA_08535 [Roseomonas sp. CCTCC AB2023176]|uniref:hypothetical protein n=1 Tax=Roseomonas sp. CCTCC AB2023176 TaxID=3342640 RepID=UPI0035DEB20F
MFPRRSLLAATLAGCAGPLPDGPAAETGDGRDLLARAAAAHGMGDFHAVRAVRVSYDGTWAPLIDRLQPALVDLGHRGASEERIAPTEGLVTQSYRGPEGRKDVERHWTPSPPGSVSVRFDGREATDAERRAAAALVADGYALFLLGPLLLAGPWRTARSVVAERTGAEDITVGGQPQACDTLRVRITPGLGLSPSERLLLYLGRSDGLMRRVRFSLDGLESTRGAVAEVDAWEHRRVAGLRLPTRFQERLLRPLQMPVHDWWATDLAVDTA